MKTPFAARILSASGVVGPFAASATIFVFTLGAFFSVIWFSYAAGIRTSHSISRSSAFVISLEPGKPTTVPCSFFHARTFGMSRPSAW